MTMTEPAAARAAGRIQTLARRAPTPAMVEKAATIGRALTRAEVGRRLPLGSLIAGVAGLPPAEVRRIVADGERKMRLARDLPPFRAQTKGI